MKLMIVKTRPFLALILYIYMKINENLWMYICGGFILLKYSKRKLYCVTYKYENVRVAVYVSYVHLDIQMDFGWTALYTIINILP